MTFCGNLIFKEDTQENACKKMMMQVHSTENTKRNNYPMSELFFEFLNTYSLKTQYILKFSL